MGYTFYYIYSRIMKGLEWISTAVVIASIFINFNPTILAIAAFFFVVFIGKIWAIVDMAIKAWANLGYIDGTRAMYDIANKLNGTDDPA